jgi:hypothetical protein
MLFMPCLGMTFRAVIHLHAFPWIGRVPGNVVAPDISAVGGDPVFLVVREFFALPVTAVACLAILLSHFDVGNMGEVNAVRLLVIREPWHLFAGCDELLREFLLFGVFPEGGLRIIVTRHAGFELRHADEGPVFSKAVAVKTSLLFGCPFDAYVRVRVDSMAELDGLGLLGVKELRENEPPESQGWDHTGKEIDEAAPERLRYEVNVI